MERNSNCKEVRVRALTKAKGPKGRVGLSEVSSSEE